MCELIDTGGEGDVYRAECTSSGAIVAIKCLEADKAAPHYSRLQARFQRAATMRFNHPNVLDPIDAFDADDKPHVVMPFVEGMSLDQWVASKGGPAPIDESTRLFKALTQAVSAVHKQGVVHRDIKPSNILITDGNGPFLIDFGIARPNNEPAITNGEILGTFAWMSPEQTKSAQVDQRSDLFSVGLVFFFVLTATPPIPAHACEDEIKHKLRNHDHDWPSCAFAKWID